MSFIETKKWSFGGGISKSEISGCVEVPKNLTKERFCKELFEYIQSKGWIFEGKIAEIMDGYYILPDGSKGRYVLDDLEMI